MRVPSDLFKEESKYKQMKVLFTISVLLILFSMDGKATDTTFTYTYGGVRYEEGTSVAATFDGGYIMVGSTGSFGLGNSDIYIVKADSSGAVEWSNSYGGLQLDFGMNVKQTADSGYVIVGYTNSYGAGGYDVFMVRTNQLGDTLWTKTFGGMDWDLGYDVVETLDGGFVVVGETYSFGAGDNDVYVIKTNANGDSLWTKTYGGNKEDYGRAVVETADSNLLIGGATFTFDVDSGDAFMIRTNNQGDTIWTANYGGTGTDFANDVIETMDGGFAFLGTTTSYNSKNKDFYFARINQAGVLSWFKAIGSLEGDEEGFSLVEIRFERYALLGHSGYFGTGGYDLYLVATNEIGGFLFGRTYGFTGNESGHSLAKRENGGMALFGSTNSVGTGLSDMFLLTTDSVGKDFNDLVFSSITYVAYFDTTLPDVPLSVGDIINPDRKVSVYPNPANGQVNINIAGESRVNKSTVFELYDLTGRMVLSTALNNTSPHSINLSNMISGVYFYDIIIRDKSQAHESEVYKGKLVLTAD